MLVGVRTLIAEKLLAMGVPGGDNIERDLKNQGGHL